MRTISEIIADAGGPDAISAEKAEDLTPSAVHKWKRNGVPDRHWPILIKLAGATPDELFAANKAAREHAA